MISLKANSIFKILKIIKFKNSIDFINPPRSKNRHIPKFITNNFNVSKQLILNRNAYTISSTKDDYSQHIVYFHGGGYSIEPSVGHFRFIEKIINMTNCTVTFIEYPLVPENDVNDAMSVSLESYKQLIKLHPHHSFILMGDSAGGGLALSIAMLIRDLKLKQPKKIFLYSPWLDIRLENPKISYYEDFDNILNRERLKQVGLLYANGISLKDYRVSPIEGNLDNLGEIAVFYGTDEIFRPDCEVLCNEKNPQNTIIKPFKYEGMQHDWVIFPIPEQIYAIKDVALFLNS